MTQDITVERARLMTGGKRGPRPVTDTFYTIENFSMVYNGDGDVQTIIKEQIREDGTIWRKTLTFTYEAPGKMSGKTEVLELVI